VCATARAAFLEIGVFVLDVIYVVGILALIALIAVIGKAVEKL
jgi:hypothetical protein